MGGELTEHVDTGVCHLMIDRPASGNTLDAETMATLTERLRDVRLEDGVGAVIITGAGAQYFCRGAEPDSGPAQRWQDLIAGILDCGKPVIAAVNGNALRGGCHVALACDLVVVAQHARFEQIFVTDPQATDVGGAYLLSRLIGSHKAKELAFFGDGLPATEAARLGLVNRVVVGAKVPETAMEWAQRLAATPPAVLAAVKDVVKGTARAEAFAREARLADYG